MNLPLPDQLHSAGFTLYLNLQELPKRSYTVHAYLNPTHANNPTDCRVGGFTIYGRGDAQASERPRIVLLVKAEMVKAHGRSSGNVLQLKGESLKGDPVTLEDLKMAPPDLKPNPS